MPQDEELAPWERPALNPVPAIGAHGSLTVSPWRDPFVASSGSSRPAPAAGRPISKRFAAAPSPGPRSTSHRALPLTVASGLMPLRGRITETDFRPGFDETRSKLVGSPPRQAGGRGVRERRRSRDRQHRRRATFRHRRGGGLAASRWSRSVRGQTSRRQRPVCSSRRGPDRLDPQACPVRLEPFQVAVGFKASVAIAGGRYSLTGVSILSMLAAAS